jgi:nucleoside-diphosphate-sugar epimerase
MKVAITGICGYLGRLVLKELEKDPEIEQIVGIDVCEPPSSTKLHFHKMDVRDPAIINALKGCDKLVHLAFIVMPRRGKESVMDSINIEGTQNVFRKANEAGIRRIVYTSSVAAYGAWPDNPIPIKEDWPCRVMPDFYYARAKATVENWLDHFEDENPEFAIIRLRPHIFVGPEVDNLTNEIHSMDYLVSFKGSDLYLQYLWDQDVVDAIRIGIKGDHRGAFNLASDDYVPVEEAAQLLNKQVKEMPFGVALISTRIRWTLRMTQQLHPGWVKCMRYPILVDNHRAKEELGWRPSKTTHDILLEMKNIFNL